MSQEKLQTMVLQFFLFLFWGGGGGDTGVLWDCSSSELFSVSFGSNLSPKGKYKQCLCNFFSGTNKYFLYTPYSKIAVI